MKKLLLTLLLSLPLFSQEQKLVNYQLTNPSGACRTTLPLWNNWVLGRVYQCVGPNKLPGAGLWQLISAGSSGPTGAAGGALGGTYPNPTINVSGPITNVANVLGCAVATGSIPGCVAAADWTTFNGKQAALGFTAENVANKSTDGTLAANSDTNYSSQKAVKTYVDARVGTGAITLKGGAGTPNAGGTNPTTCTAPTASAKTEYTDSSSANLDTWDCSGTDAWELRVRSSGGPGVSIGFTEGTCTAGIASSDILCADSTLHGFVKFDNNGAKQRTVGASGTTTVNNCPKFGDSFGNLVDSGSTCGGGGVSTQTQSFIVVPYDNFSAASTVQASGVIYCYDFPLGVPTTVATAYYLVAAAGSSGYLGVAIYDADGARLTAASQTGTDATLTGARSVGLGGGSLVLTPGTKGKFSLCYTSSNGTSSWQGYGPGAQGFGYLQPTGVASIVFTAQNAATFATATITWPATLGTKTAAAGGAQFPGFLVTP